MRLLPERGAPNGVSRGGESEDDRITEAGSGAGAVGGLRAALWRGPAGTRGGAAVAGPVMQPRLNIAFVLARRFTLSAYANFVDVLRLAADEGDRSRPILCRWSVIAPDLAPVAASCGTRVEPDARPDDPAAYDYIVVIGGVMGATQPLDPALTAFLNRAAAAGVPLAGVCTGVFILARAGLMARRRCCVSWFHHDDFRAEFPDLTPVSDQIFVVDGDRLSSAGGVSAAHLAAFLVDRHIGRAAARKSLAIMMIDGPQAESAPQPGLPLELTTTDPLVRRALAAMQQRIDSPPTIAALADLLGVGRRRLERRFTAALNLSPAEAALQLRLAQARLQLERSSRSVAEIADDTGFCDASHLVRAFREAHGETPDRWRRRRVASEM